MLYIHIIYKACICTVTALINIHFSFFYVTCALIIMANSKLRQPGQDFDMTRFVIKQT